MEKRREIRLHPGENDVGQQFWEDAKDELCIFKNRGEKVWLAMHKDRVVEDMAEFRRRQKEYPRLISVSMSAKSAPELAKKLEEELEIKIHLDRDKRWLPDPKGENKHMILYSRFGDPDA